MIYHRLPCPAVAVWAQYRSLRRAMRSRITRRYDQRVTNVDEVLVGRLALLIKPGSSTYVGILIGVDEDGGIALAHCQWMHRGWRDAAALALAALGIRDIKAPKERRDTSLAGVAMLMPAPTIRAAAEVALLAWLRL